MRGAEGRLSVPLPSSMLLLLLCVSWCTAQTQAPGRCDVEQNMLHHTVCTSCAASGTSSCPAPFTKTTTGMGVANCSYVVEIGGRGVELPGCRQTCSRAVLKTRCCPDHWGPLCLRCPSALGKVCNFHGTCQDGELGNGTCVCDVGFSGVSCEKCQDLNTYGPSCDKQCDCVYGVCNSGPEGNGECYCQPPYSGPRCDQVSTGCKNCSSYSYCKTVGDAALCDCLPGHRKTSRNTCPSVCSQGDCDVNAECSVSGSKVQCACKQGYRGDGKICAPINPCSVDNGGCPLDSTVCVFKGPDKSSCECMAGMSPVNSTVRLGCHAISACSSNPCHSTATCQTGLDGQPRCECAKNEVGDGRRCYGNLFTMLLELDRGGPLRGKLSAAIRNAIGEEGCELKLTQHGPYTAFIPVSGVNDTEAGVFPLCQNHLMVGQHLYEHLEGQDFNLDGGRVPARNKGNKQFILLQAPSRLYTILQANIPASNGIIHIIDRPVTVSEPLPGSPRNEQFADKTIGEILTLDEKYNRFLSLVDNCGAPLPLRGPGPLTVFVPTNQAIDRARDGSIIYMLHHAQHKLQEMLKYHMFSHAALTVDELASLGQVSQVQTMANQMIRITVADDGRILLGEIDATLESSNIMASNGIIHMVGGLLIPPSIQPILPHRCDVIQSKITVGPCVRCSYLYQTQCPESSIELDSHLTGCTYVTSPLDSSFSKGCAKYCNVTTEVAECCKGFYGPDCKPCIGGFQHPCYDKGTCFDGIHGNGSCSCQSAFKGMACHICADPSRYGDQCDQECVCVHGECDNRPHSGGVCRRGSCKEGFHGSLCDQTAAACNSDGLYQHCHLQAYCVTEGIHTKCVCNTGYEGDGNSCTLVNPCLRSDRGGCDINAECVFAGVVNVSCVCSEGWSGDGSVCVEIDNCQLASRGGCHPDADCKYIGPAQSECMCKTGYMGDGTIICDYISPCLTDNGGCHSLATCAYNENGLHHCTCPEGYHGDGKLCYGTILQELDNGDDSAMYTFYLMMKLSSVIGDVSGNVTALVPSSKATGGAMSSAQHRFWHKRHRLPHFVKAHFLPGVYSVEQLERLAGGTVPTLSPPTRWAVSNDTGVLKIGNVSIIRANLPAVNGYLHVIDQFLFPPISDLPADPHSLMEFLNSTSNFSLFKEHALLFNLSERLDMYSNTVLLPTDDAVRDYMGKTNSTRLTLEVFEYHIIPDHLLFPDQVTDGLLKGTLLGPDHQVQFHLNQHNQSMVNDVALDGGFVETTDPPAVLMVLNQVLRVRKNRCSKPVTMQVNGECTDCEGPPRCTHSFLKPVRSAFPPKMKPNCEYRKRVGTRRKLVDGCLIKCVYITNDHSCCRGFYGHECYKCPGDQDSPCSNHGQCQDGDLGNGECRCYEGFHGSACEGCEPGRYGSNCTAKCACGQGKCDDGLTGSGRCVCYKGWKGVSCTVEIKDDACGGVCDENANCITGPMGEAATCVCVAGYQGNGTHCKEMDLCSVSNGGCSELAVCAKVSAGERTCSCKEGYTGDGVDCQEIDGCLVNNGGCNPNSAACVRTGPNTTVCTCLPGFTGRSFCYPINPCSIDNGGCGMFVRCVSTRGQVNCTCSIGMIPDGKDCRASTRTEIAVRPENTFFRHMLTSAGRTFSGSGPFTIFVPVQENRDNSTLEEWKASGHLPKLLWNHVVSCEKLRWDDLKTTPHAVSVSGDTLNFTVTQGSVYVNGVKVVKADVPTTDGVIHYVQSVLTPFRLQDKPPVLPKMNFTEAAEMYGYRKFSKMVQDAGMLPVIHMKIHQPLTMFWPTDQALDSMSAERVQYLFNPEHRHLLAATVRAHIVRNLEFSTFTRFRRATTMHGSTIKHSCDQTLPGNVLLNDNSARVVERSLVFTGGVAHGIDQLLEPPDLGARCDGLKNRTFLGRCGSCAMTPLCTSRSTYTGQIKSCRFGMKPYFGRTHSWSRYLSTDDFFHTGAGFGSRRGCNRECQVVDWVDQCCKKHFGPNCQVCPGGLEAPCGDHGDCDDGMKGTGTCVCHQGFRGTACELCRPGHYGANCTACNCTSGGWCDDGVDGSGRCVCRTDWTGERCDIKLEELPKECTQCHAEAVCVPGSGCHCKEQYEGNGTHCSPMPPPDLCAEYNGGCHDNADCNQTEFVVNCTCQTGYQGDGLSCQPINRCIEEVKGGCSDFATCTFTGPNERRCECLPGYVGNGTQCLEKVVPPVDRCLEGNGGCDPKASCKDLHYHENRAGVFLFRSSLGKYKLNFSEAEQSCRAEEASLATFKQLGDAQQLGLHMCSAGWLDGGQVGYPTRFPSAKCGDGHVGVVLYKEPVDQSSKYDAYCYRMADVSCACSQGYVGDGGFCNGDLSSVLATTPTFSVFYKHLLDYSASSVAGSELVNFLSKNNADVTLFVPHNDGFGPNQTLTGRDLEYHFTANQSRVQYQGVTHEAVIFSRLGFNLTIYMNESCKLVNQRPFVDWDIPATNGIIHVIQGPLTAPPPPISPHPSRGHAHSSSIAWVVVVMILLLVAGVSYYVYKQRGHAFRFQYFKNEEENAASTQTDAPALVTFPNPLYRGQTAFNEPFEDSTQEAAAADPPGLTEAEKVVELE